jgi:hypothetical protein
MKYLILMYAPEGAWPPNEHRVALEQSVALCHQLHERGQYVSAAPLQPPDTTVQVRVRNGVTSTLDGPFAETKEQLGGYFLVDVESMEEAVAIAERLPGSQRGTAVIRPLLEVSGLPER